MGRRERVPHSEAVRHYKVGANGEFGQNRTLSLKVLSCMTYRIL